MKGGQKPLHALSIVPAVVTSIEGLFGRRTGKEKKESAMSFVLAAVQLKEALESREIVDEERFREGLGKMVDGVVDCLNASSWARADE
jgi:hypothetical protein